MIAHLSRSKNEGQTIPGGHCPGLAMLQKTHIAGHQKRSLLCWLSLATAIRFRAKALCTVLFLVTAAYSIPTNA